MNEYRKFLTERLGYFRSKAKLSTRELSLRMGFSGGYISKFEMGAINMPTEVLLDALKVLNVTPQEFFSANPETYAQTAAMVQDYENLSLKNKDLVKNLIEALK